MDEFDDINRTIHEDGEFALAITAEAYTEDTQELLDDIEDLLDDYQDQ